MAEETADRGQALETAGNPIKPIKPRRKAKIDNAERLAICYNKTDYMQTERQIVRGADMHR